MINKNYIVFDDDLICNGAKSLSPTKTQGIYKDAKIIVFPNPTNDIIHIRWQPIAKTTTLIQLVDLRGTVIWTTQKTEDESSQEISTQTFPKGLYLLRLKQGELDNYVKVVIQ